MKKDKILFVIHSLDNGGAENQLLSSAKYLCNDFEVYILCLEKSGYQNKDRGIRIDYLRRNDDIHKTIRGMMHYLKAVSPSVIHGILFRSWLAAIAGRLAGVPVVICQRDTAEYPEKFKRYSNLIALANKVSDMVIVCSEAVRNAVLKNEEVLKNKVKLVYNGVGLNNPYPEFTDSQYFPRVGIISNLIEGKGHKDFLMAAKSVLCVYPCASFYIVGDGPCRKSLELFSRKMNIHRNVKFMGYRRDVAGILKKLDVVVFCSKLKEGCPMTILEAMAAGKPVISTATGGIPEIISNGIDGILVRPGDVKAMASAILRLSADKILSHKIGLAGYKRVRNSFSLAQRNRYLAEIYKQLLNKNAKNSKNNFIS